MAPAYFFNSTLNAPYVNARGVWLNSPQAVLYGISGGLYRNVPLLLRNPVLDQDAQVGPWLRHLKCSLHLPGWLLCTKCMPVPPTPCDAVLLYNVLRQL